MVWACSGLVLGLSCERTWVLRFEMVALGLLLSALIGLRSRRSRSPDLAGCAVTILALVSFGLGQGLPVEPVDSGEISRRHPARIVAYVMSYGELQDESRTRFRISVRRVEQRGREWNGAWDAWMTVPEASASSLHLGSEMVLRGYFGRIPPAANGGWSAPGPWWINVESARLLEVTRPAPAWSARLGGWRRGWVERLNGSAGWAAMGAVSAKQDLHALSAAVSSALVLGDRTGLPPDILRLARASGTFHLLAVSGFHVGLLAFLVHGVGASLPPPLRRLLAAAALLLCAGLVGPKAAVTRAVLMGLGVLLALALGRPPRPLSLLAGSAWLMLFAHPPWLDDLGFWLSFAATAALVACLPLWLRNLSGVQAGGARPEGGKLGRGGRALRVLGWSMAASFCAQLATAPWLWPRLSMVHPWAPLVDLLAVPWLGLVLALAWVAMAILGLSTVFGQDPLPWLEPLAWVMWTLTAPIRALAQSPPVGRNVLVDVDPRQATALALILLVLGVGLSVWTVRVRPKSWILGLWLGVGLACGLLGPTLMFPDARRIGGGVDYRLAFLDVGQGDAMLLQGPNLAILVDGGGRRHSEIAGPVLVPALARLGVRRLDAVVMTHGDGDHCRGLVELLSYLPVDEMWASSGWTGACVEELGRRRSLRRRHLHRGGEFEIAGWRFEVLWPPARAPRDGNESSLVMKATAGGRSVLLTADAGKASEASWLSHGADLRADILKVGHHGSRSSTSEGLLNAVNPKLAVISCGRDNRYGHPHAAVVHRLRRRGLTVLRTDRQGIVEVSWRRNGPLHIDLPATPLGVR